MSIKSINPQDIPTADMHQYLLSAVAPRPIAFVSTVDEAGNANLAPYSFFNAFSSNPPILVFSSNRRVKNNTTKDTLHNVTATREAVINVISHSIVRQAALAACEYAHDVDEFVKAGFTKLPSEVVKAYRVAEAPVQMECIINDIIPLGEHGGAGNLIICEVVRFHVHESVLDERGKIDQQKIDLMGRMGRIFYVRASGEAIFPIAQPVEPLGMGFDNLPVELLHSTVLTGNDLAMLAGVPDMPTPEAIAALRPTITGIDTLTQKHTLVQAYLQKNDIATAWKVALL